MSNVLKTLLLIYATVMVNIQVRENGKEDKIIKRRRRLSNGLNELRVKKRPPG